MGTSSAESIPLEPNPEAGHQHTLSLPQDQAQINRAASPAQGSTSSTSTAVNKYFDRVKPTWTVNRYERTAKLEGPFIELELDPITTCFADE